MVNAVSIDLEDWYHICGVENPDWTTEWKKYSTRLERNLDKILVLLEKYDITATFFVVGYIAEQRPDLIRRIAEKGHEIASHGYFHRRIFDTTPAEFEDDLIKSKNAIENVTGKKVKGYRAPEWSLKEDTRWALDILKKNGFEYDASANPISHLSGKGFGIYPGELDTKHGKIWEFPLSTFRMFAERLPFSGGLPLRVTPYCNIFGFFKRFNRAGIPVMMYLHPWEFDKQHPKIDLPLNRKFMHYFNCRVAPIKAEKLFQHFDFTTVENIIDMKRTGKNTHRSLKQPKPHKEYLVSAFLTVSAFLLLYSALFILPKFIGWYALALILIGATILYWPWTHISDCIGSIRKRMRS